MAESTKYIWCQHCYTGWIAKEDKPYYPKCWSCGMGWRKRTRRPRWWSVEDAWDAQWPQPYPAQEVGYYPPPGLGRPSAEPGTQRLLRAAGVPPPDPEEHENCAEQSNQCLQDGDGRAEDTGGEKGQTAGQGGPSQS